MKTAILCALTAAALVTGCTQTHKNMGAANENDRNVLTGGPVSGTTLGDLPDPVKKTLRELAPNGEVADVDKQTLNGQTVYKISFAEPGKNPTIYVTESGNTIQNPHIKTRSEK